MDKIKENKYDLIFGIGQNCLVPEVLRENELIYFATPFDWVQIYGYDAAINILKNKFQNFFRKEDLEFMVVGDYDFSEVFYNKKTQIVDPHNFGINARKHFDEIYERINNKVQRRIARILKKISSCKKICLVYIESADLADKNIEISNDIILKDIAELENIYHQKFDVFYIKHNPNLGPNEYNVDNKICEINNSALESGRLEYRGNKPLVRHVISQRMALNFRIFVKSVIKIKKFMKFLKILFLLLKLQYM